MQNFVSQVETIVDDAALRQRLIANAKAYVESSFNDNVEFRAYSKITGEMCDKENASENGDDQSDESTERRVHFVTDNTKRKVRAAVSALAAKGSTLESTEQPDATEAWSSSKQREEQKPLVENETLKRKPEESADTPPSTSGSRRSVSFVASNVDVPLDGKKKTSFETAQTTLKPDSGPEKNEQQSVKAEGGDVRPTEKADGVKQMAASTAPSSTSPKVAAAVKSDARKQTTDSASSSTLEKTSSPPSAAASGKGGTTRAGNGRKHQPVTRMMSESGKLGTKKTPLHGTESADRALLKPAPLTPTHNRSRSGSDTRASSRPSSRAQKTKK